MYTTPFNNFRKLSLATLSLLIATTHIVQATTSTTFTSLPALEVTLTIRYCVPRQDNGEMVEDDNDFDKPFKEIKNLKEYFSKNKMPEKEVTFNNFNNPIKFDLPLDKEYSTRCRGERKIKSMRLDLKTRTVGASKSVLRIWARRAGIENFPKDIEDLTFQFIFFSFEQALKFHPSILGPLNEVSDSWVRVYSRTLTEGDSGCRSEVQPEQVLQNYEVQPEQVLQKLARQLDSSGETSLHLCSVSLNKDLYSITQTPQALCRCKSKIDRAILIGSGNEEYTDEDTRDDTADINITAAVGSQRFVEELAKLNPKSLDIDEPPSRRLNASERELKKEFIFFLLVLKTIFR